MGLQFMLGSVLGVGTTRLGVLLPDSVGMYGLGIEFAAEGFGRRGSVVFLECRLFSASGCRPGGLLTEVVAGLNYLGRYKAVWVEGFRVWIACWQAFLWFSFKGQTNSQPVAHTSVANQKQCTNLNKYQAYSLSI